MEPALITVPLRSALTDQFSELNARLSTLETTPAKPHARGHDDEQEEEADEAESGPEDEGDDEQEVLLKI